MPANAWVSFVVHEQFMQRKSLSIAHQRFVKMQLFCMKNRKQARDEYQER
jgi:hypothetical protein